VLVTRVVADLCAGKTFRFASVGSAQLKGFDEPVELFEVGV
jgi:class 3 adenylate cyclase